MDIEAVIFDYGGVLSTDQPAPDRARVEALAGGPKVWPAYWALREAYDLGQLTAEQYWRQVGDQIGQPMDPERIRGLLAADTDGWSHPNLPVVRWAEALAAAGVRIGLISNMPHELADHVRHRQAWMPAMEWMTFSCDVGTVKPDPAIYRHCLDGLGIQPEAAVFIDDREENIVGAGALGLRGFWYTGAAALAADVAEVDGLPRVPEA